MIEQPYPQQTRGGLRLQICNIWNKSLNDVTRRPSRHPQINSNSTLVSLQSPEGVQRDGTNIFLIKILFQHLIYNATLQNIVLFLGLLRHDPSNKYFGYLIGLNDMEEEGNFTWSDGTQVTNVFFY